MTMMGTGDGELTRRDQPGSVGHKTPAGLEVWHPEPLPTGTGLGFGTGPTRDQLWAALPAAVRARMAELGGDTLAWWAESRYGTDRPYAVLGGRSGLCFATPRIDADRREVYEIVCFKLDRDSFRVLDVESRPPVPTTGSAPAPPRPRGGPPTPNGDDDLPPGLSAAGAQLLRNLPVRAVHVLTAPFDAARPVLRCEWYYLGSALDLPVFVVFLAGERHVTMATGSRVVPVGGTEQTGHWSLRCMRADVTGRIGR